MEVVQKKNAYSTFGILTGSNCHRNIENAHALESELASPKVLAKGLDAHNRKSIFQAIAGSEVVLNCAGPFYIHGKTDSVNNY